MSTLGTCKLQTPHWWLWVRVKTELYLNLWGLFGGYTAACFLNNSWKSKLCSEIFFVPVWYFFLRLTSPRAFYSAAVSFFPPTGPEGGGLHQRKTSAEAGRLSSRKNLLVLKAILNNAACFRWIKLPNSIKHHYLKLHFPPKGRNNSRQFWHFIYFA